MDSQVRLMEAEIVPPESFVAVDHRLFIDPVGGARTRPSATPTGSSSLRKS
jgi:hypothetical protein